MNPHRAGAEFPLRSGFYSRHPVLETGSQTTILRMPHPSFLCSGGAFGPVQFFPAHGLISTVLQRIQQRSGRLRDLVSMKSAQRLAVQAFASAEVLICSSELGHLGFSSHRIARLRFEFSAPGTNPRRLDVLMSRSVSFAIQSLPIRRAPGFSITGLWSIL